MPGKTGWTILIGRVNWLSCHFFKENILDFAINHWFSILPVIAVSKAVLSLSKHWFWFYFWSFSILWWSGISPLATSFSYKNLCHIHIFKLEQFLITKIPLVTVLHYIFSHAVWISCRLQKFTNAWGVDWDNYFSVFTAKHALISKLYNLHFFSILSLRRWIGMILKSVILDCDKCFYTPFTFLHQYIDEGFTVDWWLDHVIIYIPLITLFFGNW